MSEQIQLRRGTAAQWTSVNPVLAQAEMGVETDTAKFKFGNGVTAWNLLAYAVASGGGSGQLDGGTPTSTYGAVSPVDGGTP